ncbi:MAG: hypothetical protein IIY45_11640 [Firmicutes bacterium]|nr:hypothetical protein [Bacillota bacterium]
MHEIKNDVFYDLIKQYDEDMEDPLIGEVGYYLLRDDKPYEGQNSHREALRLVFELLAEKSIEDRESAREMWGDRIADQLRPLVYDIDKAQAAPLGPGVFFYCPDIVKIDYYGNVFYDAEWKPDDENCGTTVPYWYALMEPVHGRRNRPEDFKKVNEVLFPNGTDRLDIYEWTTDWSDFFDAGHEWYGACCWTVYDGSMDRYAVMIDSATD